MPKGLWYLVALRFLNKTWGRVTEMGDFYRIFSRNIRLPHMEIQLPSGEVITVQEGQRLSSIPLEYQAVVLQALVENGHDVHQEFTLDFENFMVELFFMEVVDTAIGIMMQTERQIIDDAGLRGLFDYGNATTWAKRIVKIIEANRARQTEQDSKE